MDANKIWRRRRCIRSIHIHMRRQSHIFIWYENWRKFLFRKFCYSFSLGAENEWMREKWRKMYNRKILYTNNIPKCALLNALFIKNVINSIRENLWNFYMIYTKEAKQILSLLYFCIMRSNLWCCICNLYVASVKLISDGVDGIFCVNNIPHRKKTTFIIKTTL